MTSKLNNLLRPEVEITKRRRLSKAEKKALDERDGHCCVECGVEENLQEEHRIARAIKPDDTIENVRWMCEACHSKKTPKDRKAIAKAKRLSDKLRGADKKPKFKIPSRGFQKGHKPIPSRPWSKT